MSDLPQQNTIIQYLADGVTATYIVPFFVPIESDGTPDIDVYTQASNASPVPESDIKIWGVDYTYTPNLDPITGGIVTFLGGHIPQLDYVVTIVRNVSASLNVEFSQAQTFSGFTLDAALDKLLLISQQNKSYAFDRNISYIVNSYIPEEQLLANVQIPVLQPGQVWLGSLGGVIAATLEQPADVSTLRSELANNQPITNGAALVGFYDETNMVPTTVAAQLNYLSDLVSAAIPPGCMIDFGGLVAPAGFLLCDGAEVSRATYTNLFNNIGTLWGAGNGTTTFNVPDYRGYVSAGAGGSLLPFGNTVADSGGAIEVALIAANLAAHAHGFSSGFPSVTPRGTSPGTNINAGSPTGVSDTTDDGPGTSVPFGIIQPTKIALRIIKF